ncbi:MAG: ligase-associated DNA damage response exonuclease [Desulfobacterales bacterium]|nr:MAG: ligase-associated DNA damage response exonuclease [Desulfobacterales bacterium]
MPNSRLLELTAAGLYCRIGDFYIDPWRPVGKAVITHAHADHAREGNQSYLVSDQGAPLLRLRLGPGAEIQSVPYGESLNINGLHLSLHPAGHILGSAQIRIEHRNEVWVVSGDYKIEPDPTCTPLEPVRCHTFVTESTFGLPIFRWRPQAAILAEITHWWRQNRARGQTSIMYAYALGKAQRILAGLEPSLGPILTHGAVETVNQVYRAAGVFLPPTQSVADLKSKKDCAGALVLAPPSANGTPWSRKFMHPVQAFASGWMQIRGNRRRRALDRGFVLSDHTDWSGLLGTIRETGAANIWVTHGYADELARWLQEKGLNARTISTRFRGESDDAGQ